MLDLYINKNKINSMTGKTHTCLTEVIIIKSEYRYHQMFYTIIIEC